MQIRPSRCLSLFAALIVTGTLSTTLSAGEQSSGSSCSSCSGSDNFFAGCKTGFWRKIWHGGVLCGACNTGFWREHRRIGGYAVDHANCACNGSYKHPVPPLSTYHWPGMYSHQLMTNYHSPHRFPPLKPYEDELSPGELDHYRVPVGQEPLLPPVPEGASQSQVEPRRSFTDLLLGRRESPKR